VAAANRVDFAFDGPKAKREPVMLAVIVDLVLHT
jgi:hypothetical protein